MIRRSHSPCAFAEFAASTGGRGVGGGGVADFTGATAVVVMVGV